MISRKRAPHRKDFVQQEAIRTKADDTRDDVDGEAEREDSVSRRVELDLNQLFCVVDLAVKVLHPTYHSIRHLVLNEKSAVHVSD